MHGLMPRGGNDKTADQGNLFGWVDSPSIYPHVPGFKGDPDGPGAQAAHAIKPAVKGLQRAVLDVLKVADLTADQVASAIGRNILSVRPRVAELRALGLIEPTAARGVNESGLSANRWRPTQEGRAA